MNEVEEIKARLDLVEVVGGYVQLKQAGRNFKGLSPFKAEKTPSFMVSSEKGIWHDFSSGKGGDIFSFVMLMEGIEFREALEMLARRAGVELKPRSPGNAIKKDDNTRLYDAVELAMKYFHLCLSENQKAKDYFMQERGLSAQTLKKYKLGYSPDSWESLSKYLEQNGFSQSEMLKAGLVKQKSGKTTIFDAFRNRVMFPVFDVQSRVVGFSARILPGDKNGAKYINTSETPIYHKALVLYGLCQAKEAIREQDEVIVVEGNMDVVALANKGYKNVVASSGTALTLEQIKILMRLSSNIKLCFDMDEAGILATKRVIDIVVGLDVKIFVIELKGAKDPDEFIQKDAKAWEEAVKKAKYVFDYCIDSANRQNDINTALGKKQFAREVLPVVATITDEVEKVHYVKRISQLLGVDEQIILQRINGEKPIVVESVNKLDSTSELVEPKLSRQEKIEQALLEILLVSDVSRAVLSEIDLNSISNRHKAIYETLVRSPKITVVRLVKLLPEQGNYVNIISLRGEHVYADLSEHDARLEAFTQVNRLNKILREKTKRELSTQIAQAEADGDSKLREKLLYKYQKLLLEDY